MPPTFTDRLGEAELERQRRARAALADDRERVLELVLLAVGVLRLERSR